MKIVLLSGLYRHADPLVDPHPAFSAIAPVFSAIQAAATLYSALDEVVDAVHLSTVNF